MGRLFDKSENVTLEVGQIVRNGEPVDVVSLYEADDSVGIVTESFKPVLHYYEAITHIEKALTEKNTILAVEAYNPLLKSLASNLGCKTAIPSLEDYKNPYSAKASKDVALESLSSMLKKVWDAIKKFFSDFFKKVSEFGKRLVNANLQIDTYERYVPDLLKKINRDKLTCSDPSKEVNTKLVQLLAPEGLDKLDGVWVPQNLPPIVSATVGAIEFIIKNTIPNISNKAFPDFINEVSEKLSRIRNISVESELEATLDEISKEVDRFILGVVKALCSVPTDEKQIPEQAYDKLADLLVDNTLSSLTLHMFLDTKNNMYRLPKNFNLVIGVSPEDKLYSVAVTEDNNNKSNTIPVLQDLKALELVYDNYKELTKKFDIKSISRSFLDIDKAVSGFIGNASRMVEKYKKEYKTFSIGTANHDLSNVGEEESVINAMFSYLKGPYLTNENQLKTKYDNIIKGKEVRELTFGEVRELLNLVQNEIKPFYTDQYVSGIDNEDLRTDALTIKNNAIPVLEKTLTHILKNTKDSDLGKVVVDRISDIEKRLINFSQNLQVALRAIETTFPGIVTDLRYELLKYVYDSARNFD